MSRPRSDANLTKADRARINDWFDDGLSVREIVGLTRTVLEKPKNERQVYRYQREWRDWKAGKEKEAADLELPPSDDPVDWVTLRSSMSAFEISRATLPVIRFAHAWAESTFRNIFRTQLTYRSARWYAYVLDYAPSIQLPIDVWSIGEQYAYRERAADFSGQPMERSDLDEWLSYQPWLNEEQEARYLGAVKDGIVPELPDLDQPVHTTLAEGQEPGGEEARWMMGRGMLSAVLCRLVSAQRHQLPSWQVKYSTSNSSFKVVVFRYGNTKPVRIRLG